MNIQQHVNEQNDIIEFKIQTLEGNDFSVSIQKSEAEKVYTCNVPFCNRSLIANPYDSYGLDFLKEAISKLNGVDPITMQLFTAQGELTTATQLLALQNQVLSLMVKTPITVTVKYTGAYVRAYALEHNIDFLKGTVAHTAPTICYIHTPEHQYDWAAHNPPPPVIRIQAVGLERDFFKISIKNLPFHLLRDSNWTYAEKFVLRPQMAMPMHLWLRLDKNTMTLD